MAYAQISASGTIRVGFAPLSEAHMSEQGRPSILRTTMPGDWWMITAIIMEIAGLLVEASSDEPGPLHGRRLCTVSGSPSASNAYIVNVHISAPVAKGRSAREQIEIPRDIRLGQALINEDGKETHIACVVWAPEYQPYWTLLLRHVRAVTSTAQLVRRKLLGETFKEILDDYYARKARGERVKLKALAEAAGVNYGSLRQAKFRYDEEQRKNAMW